MGGREECSAFDASAGTRTLTPSSENQLSNHEASNVVSKKRKREKSTMEDLLDESFTVKLHPSTTSTKPHTLHPLALIPRIHIPLSFLDILSPSGPLPVARRFEAHVKVLELEERMGNAPVVLIAQSCDGKFTFVVERVERNLYVICKLGAWVKPNQLYEGAILSRYQPSRETNTLENGSVFCEVKVDSEVPPESSKYCKKKRLAIEAIQSMIKRPAKDVVPCSLPPSALGLQPSRELELEGARDDIDVKPLAIDIFDNIRSQYFEALYVSKASLAYFAKGPLSRARAAFHLDYDSTLDMNELIEFVEGLILTTGVVDKKYKDSVPNLVSRFMPDGSMEDGSKTPQKLRKPKCKKSRPNKEGLYPAEVTYLSQWWASFEADNEKDAPGGSKEDVMRKRIAQLRIREMQLQMIVILETLALKTLATSSSDQSGELPSIGPIDGKADGKTLTCSRSRKPLDLMVLIDVNIDRLCIWQSLAVEDSQTASTLEGAAITGLRPGGMASKHDNTADTLRDFCVEVVVPFFSARLPEQCSIICRKFGGSVASPARPKLMAETSSAGSSRPGAVAKRLVPGKSRRSLRRVITDERHARDASRGPSGAISLMRSATAPAIPGLKRERSGTPILSNIPSIESQSIQVHRGGVLKSKNFSQREVDLSIIATAKDSKSKNANIETELKDAISALKKPNRQLAGQAQVEAERRAASASAHSRKTKKPVRNPSFRGIQIQSTPKGNRRRDLATENHPLGPDAESSQELNVIPHSSIPMVSLSVARALEAERTLLCEATPVRPGNKVDPATSGTPSHAPNKPFPRLLNALLEVGPQDHGGSPPSPLQTRTSDKQQFLNMPKSFDQTVKCTPSKVNAVHATPTKQGRLNFIRANPYSKSPNKTQEGADIDDVENNGDPGASGCKVDDSIYKSLGWDEYDDFQ